MKFSLNWLSDYCDWDWSVDALAERLTLSGTEVESVVRTGVDVVGVITAQILSFGPHPNADRLRLCEVFDGKEKRRIVCGAKNFVQDDIVLLALPGAALPNGLVIKTSKIRGETSEGMLCSANELGLTETSEGIMILPAGTPVGEPVSKFLPSDTIVEVEITSNRSDLLSYRGLARELVALGARLKPFETRLSQKFHQLSDWSLQIEDSQGCPRYTASLLTDAHVVPSPVWMQKRLKAGGLRPINNVVDITNFILLELGQPLHAFDADKIHGKTICVRRARLGEKLQTLSARSCELHPDDLIIVDAKGPINLVGVTGGADTAITELTTSVLLESASFQPTLIRAASRRHGLFTDAAYRFERFIDPALLDFARERATALLVEYAGAKVVGLMQNEPYTPSMRIVSLRPERFEKVIGASVSSERTSDILQKLGCASIDAGWSIPSWRPDLMREIDLIEEVIRVEGFHIVKGKMELGVAPQSEVDRIHDRNMALRRFLTSLGFYEAITSSLLPRAENGTIHVEIINPMNEENARMRSDLLSTLLPCIQGNLARGQRDILLFEIGRIFCQISASIEERERLVLVATGDYRPAHWTEPARPFDFFSLKGILEELIRLFPEVKMPVSYGYLPQELLQGYGIKVPVLAAELELPPLDARADKKFKLLPQYPALTRDLAFVVERKVPEQEIRQAIQAAHIEALESFDCFDLFEDSTGQKLDPSKKSLAYAFTYRAADRTLQEKEVEEWERKILDCVRGKTGASLRA